MNEYERNERGEGREKEREKREENSKKKEGRKEGKGWSSGSIASIAVSKQTRQGK